MKSSKPDSIAYSAIGDIKDKKGRTDHAGKDITRDRCENGLPRHEGSRRERRCAISPHLPTSPHISPHLPTSPHISPISPHISPISPLIFRSVAAAGERRRPRAARAARCRQPQPRRRDTAEIWRTGCDCCLYAAAPTPPPRRRRPLPRTQSTAVVAVVFAARRRRAMTTAMPYSQHCFIAARRRRCRPRTRA